MRFFRNMRIGKRLVILSVVLIGLITTVSAVGVVSSWNTQRNIKAAVEDNTLSHSLHYLIVAIWKASDPPTDYLATGDTDNRKTYEEEIAAVNEALARVEKAGNGHQAEQYLPRLKAAIAEMDKASREILSLENPVGNPKGQDIMDNGLDKARSEASTVAMEWSRYVDKKAAESSQATMNQTAWATLLILAVLVLAILMGVIISYMVTKSIKEPLDHLVKTTEAIAAGDLGHTVSLDTNDELGQLGRSFNQMVGNLREILDTFGDQMIASSGAVTSASEQVGHAISQIASAIQQVAAGAGQQSASAEESLTAMKTLRAAIEQIAAGAKTQGESAQQAADIIRRMAQAAEVMAHSAQEVSHASSQALQAARGGGESVQKTVAGMMRIRQTSEEASNRVRELGEQSQRIGEIIQVISDIADQTNLLALNAAIEAARAGEHGKGFAVVAEEVRKLAERSGRATKDIAALVTTIQKGVEAAVEAMASGMKEVENGGTLANSAGHALNEILEAMERTNKKIEEISSAAYTVARNAEEAVRAMDSVVEIIQQNTDATKEMAQSSTRVLESVQEVAAVSQQTAAAAEEVSASAEEVTASTDEIRRSAKALNETAESLRVLIGKHSLA